MFSSGQPLQGRALALRALSQKTTERVPVALFTWDFDYTWKVAGLEPWQLACGGSTTWHRAHIALWEMHKPDILFYSGAGTGEHDCSLTGDDSTFWYILDNNNGKRYRLTKTSLTLQEEETGRKVCDPVGDIRSTEDADRLTGRFTNWPRHYLDGLSSLIIEMDDRALVLPHHSPAYVCACYAFGFERAMEAMLDEPELFTYVCDRIAANDSGLMKELADAGAEVVFIADGWASADIISPKMFEQFALPYQESIVSACRAAGLKTVLWNEGDIGPMLAYEATLGIDAFAFEQPRKGARTTLGQVREVFGPERCLFGNLDSEGLLKRNVADEIVDAVHEQLRMAGDNAPFVFSTGSPVPNDVEVSAVETMCRAVRE